MKIKAILITAVLVVGAGAATSYFVRRSNESNVKVVEVVSVPSVNSAAYSLNESGTVSGTIISRDTQVVALDTSHELVDVYVQQGDRVKKGDKLLEYDMLGDELKEEMQELTKLGLELQLESLKKDLETMKSGRMPESNTDVDDVADPDDADDEDDGGAEFSDDYDSDSEDAAPTKRTAGGVQKQGGGAVAAADTLAGFPIHKAQTKTLPAAKLASNDYLGVMSTLSDTTLPGMLSEGSDDQVEDDEYLAILLKLASEGRLEKYEVYAKDGVLVHKDGTELDHEQIEDLITDIAADTDIDTTGLLTDEEGNLLAGFDKKDIFDDEETVGSLPGMSGGIVNDDTDDNQGGGTAGNSSVPDAIVDGETLYDGENSPALIGGNDGTEVPGETVLAAEEGQNQVNGQEGNDIIDDSDGGNGGGEGGSGSGIVTDGGTGSGENGSGGGESSGENGSGGGESSGENVSDGADGSGEELGSDVLISDDTASDELETNFEGDVLVDDGSGEVTSIVPDVNSFLSSVNTITAAVDGGWDSISSQMSAIDSAMSTFRNKFGESHEYQTVDLFGETVNVTAYSVSSLTRSQVGDATAEVMQTAYDRLCAFHFIHTMLSLNPGRAASGALDPAWATANEQAIREAVKEFASLPSSLWVPSMEGAQFSSSYAAMNNGVFSGQTMIEFLRNVVLGVNANYVMQEPTSEVPVVSTEGKMLNTNTGADSGDDSDIGYTAEELAEAIREQEKNIIETELQIREAELGIKEYKKILDGRIVYATMDGIVKNAGSKDSSSSSSFITITGREGLYVKGTVNELSLDTVKVGDIISGTSYETGSTFTAEIVEISEYPEDAGQSMYYGYGDENTNSSYYPFLAYIENAEGLEVDSYVDLSLSGTGMQTLPDGGLDSGLSLDEYFVRKDQNGRNYCFVRGKDGRLEKRYLEVGANNWGVITIKSGLSPDDYIAFPYGDGVEEGAQTKEVEYLTAVDGESY